MLDVHSSEYSRGQRFVTFGGTRVVPADKGDKSIVTDYGLEALDHKEDNSTVVDEGILEQAPRTNYNTY